MKIKKRVIPLVNKCDECKQTEDHTWRDSWTGRELCEKCVRRATWGNPEKYMK